MCDTDVMAKNIQKGETKPSLKTTEEYLLANHDKYLSERKEASDFISYYLIICYGLVGVWILLKAGIVSEWSVQGAKVNIKDTSFPNFLIFIMLICYIVIYFHIIRLAQIFHAIRENCSAIQVLNPRARPIDISEMSLFAGGVVGIILGSARAQTIVALNTFDRAGMNRKSFGEFLSVFAEWAKNNSWKNLFCLMNYTVKLVFRLWYAVPNIIIRLLVAFAIFFLPMLSIFQMSAEKLMPWEMLPAADPSLGLAERFPTAVIHLARYYIDHPLQIATLVLFFVVFFYSSKGLIQLAWRYMIDLLESFLTNLAGAKHPDLKSFLVAVLSETSPEAREMLLSSIAKEASTGK